MIKFFKRLFFKKRTEYENKIAELEQKLVEKQEHINKTNAFWKKKLYYSKHSNKS
jgi:hypothetical protein